MQAAIRDTRTGPRAGRILEWIGIGSLALLSFALMYLTFDKRLNLLDEGFILYASERVAAGQVPYRDFFTLLMPGSFCLHALLFKLFGTSIMVGRVAILAVGTALPLLVYACARRLLPWVFALLAGILAAVWGVSYGWVLPSYSWYGCILSMLALLLALRAQDGGWKPAQAAWLGFTLGMAFFFKQTFGIYSACAILAFLVVTKFGHWKMLVRTVGILTGTAILVNVPFVLWVAVKGGFHDMLQDVLSIPLGPFRDSMALPYPKLWPLAPPQGLVATGWPGVLAAARAAIPAIPILFGLYGLIWLAGAIKRREVAGGGGVANPKGLLVVLFASLVFLAAFPRADLCHILFPMPAGFIVIAILLSLMAGGLKRRLGKVPGGLVAGLLTAVVAVPLVWAPLQDTRAWNSGCTFGLYGWDRAQGIRMTQWEAERTQQVLDSIERSTMSGDDVFIVPWAAMFYFLSDRENPTRYDLLIPGNYPGDAEVEMVRALEETKPKLVVHGFEWDVDGKRFQDYLPLLHDYIRGNYVTQGWAGQYEFLERSQW